MTTYTHGNDNHEPSDESYLRWLHENGFPAMRQTLTDQRREGVVVMRSLPTGETLGVFHAVSTRDGEAQARDGQGFYALNPKDSQADEAIMEIQFSDGVWMLATSDDIELTGLSTSEPAR
jgi:hypothetical protein